MRSTLKAPIPNLHEFTKILKQETPDVLPFAWIAVKKTVLVLFVCDDEHRSRVRVVKVFRSFEVSFFVTNPDFDILATERAGLKELLDRCDLLERNVHHMASL